ncbi:uncharacterized protein VTP21DRAFT_4303 [Calcarisporiella thermophila]|uniref:uncharacterized protein n=1 Tax=Calcarisporiella thermophila TaxID=911321 RepID=UPI0037432C5D
MPTSHIIAKDTNDDAIKHRSSLGHDPPNSANDDTALLLDEDEMEMESRQPEFPPELVMEDYRQRMWRKSIGNVFWILGWYGFATCLSLYNKWMFSAQHYNFQYPLFVTSTHMLVQFTFSGLTLLSLPRLKPKRRPKGKDYLTKVLPCGVATSLDIGLSNSSLKTITLSFYTMCKSSSLAFVLLFAFLFKLERPRWSLVGIILIISLGVLLMVMDETEFVLVGFIEVMVAALLGGLRWSLTQILLERESLGMNNPIASIFFLTPVMAVVLAVTAGFVEGYDKIFLSVFFVTPSEALRTVGVILVGGCLAFMMVLAEFFLIQRTSVVTLSVCGIFKEVATIFISSLVYGDKLTPVNILGLCITLVGIALYNWLKLRRMSTEVRQKLEVTPGDLGEEIMEDEDEEERPQPRKSGVYNLVAESTLLLNDGIHLGEAEIYREGARENGESIEMR